MDHAMHLVDSLRKAVLSWYEFRPGAKVLLIVNPDMDDTILDGNKNIHIDKVCMEKSVSRQFLDKYTDYFDVIAAIRVLETAKNEIMVLQQWMCMLKATGKILLGTDNRLGLRYFCGEREPFTKHCFTGIENYQTVGKSKLKNSYKGRCYTKQEWMQILDQADITYYKFYSIYPNLESAQLVYAHDYFPNENLSIRYIPRYRNPDSVFLNEEYILSGISQSDLFHLLANAYLIECSKNNCLSDISHVTISMNRGKEYARMTKIRENHMVEKEAIFSQGVEKLRLLSKNMQDLKERGIAVVEGELLHNIYCMPYIEAPTGNEYLYSLLPEDKECFIACMDEFRRIILQSSESYEDPVYGTILKKGYIDLVPLNSFRIDGRFVFFDQEFCMQNLPANVILYRAVIIVYDQDPGLKDILPMEFFWKRYDMETHMDVWQRLESEFLLNLRNQRSLIIYDTSTMRHNRISDAIKNSIDRSDFYKKYKEECFCDLTGKKVFLFGAGKYADKFLAFYKNDYNICGILDNDTVKWGTELGDLLIAPPESIAGEKEAFKVIICAKNFGPIFRQLKNMQVENIGIYDAHYVYPGRQKLSGIYGQHKKYRVGYISGVFDLFHIGHLNMFCRAKELCEYLIVGITSDDYVRLHKQRDPYIPFCERKEMVRACKYVDEAVEIPFKYGGTVEAFQKYHFDCQFCGSDYINDPWWLEQKEYLQGYGSDLIFFPYTEQTSSTKIKALIERKLL